MKKIPALAFEFKDKPRTYIANYPGETTDLEEILLFANVDGSKPDKDKCKAFYLEQEKEQADFLIKKFGENAINNYRPSEWFKYCNLVEVEISEETFNQLLEGE
ncbi:hypothetical protein [Mammaliicoccus sciuri]|uniref:hypothetical protein n=1 Tax=Mammaliicoccus sciuri TaxID=1296 RepID=UPI000D1F3982|nr:hypothetical protein BUZ90_02790 [Mammaliicoccus sciuri]